MTRAVIAFVLVVAALSSGALQAADDAGWVTVDYAELVDRRELSHSGESVGALLARLDGRSLPPPGERPGDRTTHSLLEPLLEPYAYVLSDALDARDGLAAGPLIELGRLWGAGERQPAWAELLRARRFVVESDGRGRLRVCLPWPDAGADPVGRPASEVAGQAWRAAWPVLRHVLEAERRRLAGRPVDGAPTDTTDVESALPALEVSVHTYVHHPEHARFLLATEPLRLRVDDTRAAGDRPPFDLDALQRFLDAGLRLEGARIERDGTLRLLGSEGGSTVLGRPLSAADLAVAWRAVARGGLAEPYMSLDRGYAPQRSLVTYGGRLRDTSLGLVSLLCDIRFKTFSMGLDIVEGRDRRAQLREQLASFATHLERMARDARSAGRSAQQTRLWFYPDSVDLTLSPQGDVLVLRRVRMSAASERVEIGSSTGRSGEDPPWTQATVRAINDDYDVLAQFFPEMADLDQVVRLLAFGTWLSELAAAGAPVPDLDALLALELPPMVTPRSFPQMLAFNGLPQPGTRAEVAVVDRVPVVEALDRLDPVGAARIPPLRRFRRALAGLDPSRKDNATLLAELSALDPGALGDDWLDFHAYRAERLRMHRLSLSTLPTDERRRLAARPDASSLRVFSVAIGGLDLGMGKVLDRARAGRVAAGAAPDAAPRRRVALAPREAWRTPAAVRVAIPGHGAGRDERVNVVDLVEPTAGGARVRRVELGYGVHGPEPSVRRITLDTEGRAGEFERYESARHVRYRFDSGDGSLTARRLTPVSEPAVEPVLGEATALPQGLVLLAPRRPVDAVLSGAAAEPAETGLRLLSVATAVPLDVAVPRAVTQRLVLGRDADPTPRVALDVFDPPPPALADAESVMVVLGPDALRPPWRRAATRPLAGEEDPWRLARALDRWWNGPGSADARRPRAVLGVDPMSSPDRWAAASIGAGPARLWLPADGFPAESGFEADALAAMWPASDVIRGDAAPQGTAPLVLISAEPPERLGARLASLNDAGVLGGRVIAVWSLAGPLRPDVVASLVVEGRAAAVGLAPESIIERRELAETVGALSGALRDGVGRRPESLPGPWLWVY